MNKKILIAAFCLVMAISAIGVMATPAGPAPNAGDGISDGSGLDTPFQNGLLDGVCPGPAPNSGDGIPDGSGW